VLPPFYCLCAANVPSRPPRVIGPPFLPFITTDELVQEANVAFDLNTGLFTALRAPAATRPPQASILTAHPAPVPAFPPLGDPSTPSISSSMSSSPPASPLRPREMPIVIEHAPDPAEAETSYSVANVGIAHFVLVTGKWVGTGGWVHKMFEGYF
jgi:hypothetical protein